MDTDGNSLIWRPFPFLASLRSLKSSPYELRIAFHFKPLCLRVCVVKYASGRFNNLDHVRGGFALAQAAPPRMLLRG